MGRLTTGELFRRVEGAEPVHIPVIAARTIVAIAAMFAQPVPAGAGLARRLEMVWFGQAQAATWLESAG